MSGINSIIDWLMPIHSRYAVFAATFIFYQNQLFLFKIWVLKEKDEGWILTGLTWFLSDWKFWLMYYLVILLLGKWKHPLTALHHALSIRDHFYKLYKLSTSTPPPWRVLLNPLCPLMQDTLAITTILCSIPDSSWTSHDGWWSN